MSAAPIRILCVDDNRLMAEAMERQFQFEPGLAWVGWVERSEDAERAVEGARPHIVLFDVDMPGRDSFELVRDLSRAFPDVRIVMFSGHVRPDLIDRAVDAGAWGYVSKGAELHDVVDAIRRVASGEFILPSISSPDAHVARPVPEPR